MAGFLKWLYPGMKVKRWIALILLGVFLVGVGAAAMVLLVFLVTEETDPAMARELRLAVVGGFLLGALALIAGVWRLVRSIERLAERAGTSRSLVEVAYERRYLGRGPRVTVLGGGTGMANLLTGLKAATSELTAIITMADDGGSSGRLRKEYDMLPPGDIRKCLVALSDGDSLLGEVLRYRFNESELAGHAFGNLLLTVITRVTGDFGEAVREASRILAVRGRVLPATLDLVTLVARHTDGGAPTVGQALITRSARPILRVELSPPPPPAAADLLRAIEEAELIVLGPGSLYTSLMPNLLIDGIPQALARARGLRVFVSNILSCEGETQGYTLRKYLEALREHVAEPIFDVVLVNSGPVPRAAVGCGEAPAGGDGAAAALPVRYDPREFWETAGAAPDDWLRRLRFEQADVVSREEPARHDPARLTRALLALYERHGSPA